MKYKFIDHTADVAFEVYGKNLRELFENATMAIYDAFVNVERLEEDKHVEIEVEADGVDYLLFKWLYELLYLFVTVFLGGKSGSINVSENQDNGKIIGGKLTAEIIKVEPKAITLHNFKVEKRDGDWYAFVVIDI